MVVTGRAALLALLLTAPVALVARSLAAVLVIDGALVLLLGVDAWLAGSPRTLAFSRGGDRTTRLGEEAVVTLVVRNTGPRRLHGVLRDAWAPTAGVEVTRHALDLAPDRVVRVSSVLRPTRRGERRSDLVTVRSLGPMGLAGRQASHAVPWAVRVLPGFPSRKHLPSRLARLRELDGRTALQVRGQGTEFDSLREYVIGDDVRSIDWRATARASDVMVRTWRPERDRRVLLVLDTSRTSAARVGDGTRLDASIDAAFLLGALASRAGDRVDVLAFDRAVRADVRGATGNELLPRISAALSDVEPLLVETDAHGLVSAVNARVRQHAFVVLLTALEPSALREGLLPLLPVLAARHTVVLASVRDERLEQLAAARGDSASVYDAASAEQAIAARDRMTELVLRTGVDVIDSGPDEIAPRLADRYLALKAAGRL
ncbi:MAG TPA: DUF58 domain-containing protein [Solirubrobacteraceae bacterium]|nr:DUF58 domain-containing protein [Solirubrobacteraceae bacterium]